MPKAKVNSIEINFEINGSGVPLLLIHGHPFNRTIWDLQIEDFSKHFQVITPDLRGFGFSEVPLNRNTSFEDYATDMLCLMDFLGIKKLHLSGLSMGGQIIMEIYRQAPERIISMVFADTFAGLDSTEGKQSRLKMANRLENEGMDAYAEEVIYKMIMPKHVISKPVIAGHIIKMMKETSAIGAAIALRARSERIDYLNIVLPTIIIPTLVIVGLDDEFTPVSKAEELRKNLKNCKLEIIEEAGHLPNMEQAKIFNKVVLEFLGSA